MSKEQEVAQKVEKEQEKVKEVEEKKVEQTHKETTVPIKHYLFFINDEEGGDKVMVRAYDIMHALAIFAETYRTMCLDWSLLSLYVEEVVPIN